MERFDEYLKSRARQEPVPLPEDYAGRVFAHLRVASRNRGGTESTGRLPLFPPDGMRCGRRSGSVRGPAQPVAHTVAAAMVEVPLLGPLVEIVTFRTIPMTTATAPPT